MALAIQDFWRCLAKSRLLSPEECRRWADRHADTHQQGESAHDAAALARWLVEQGVITPFQAKTLLSGKAGPFLVGDYVIRERVERGRLAGLFRALHRPTSHPVLLHALSTADADDSAERRRVRHEAWLAAAVRHANLSQTFEPFEARRRDFIALEDLHGTTLERYVAKRGALGPKQAGRILHQAALGLAAMHAAGQTHAAIRPANLWIEPSGAAKLLQFPLARDPLTPLAPLSLEPDGRDRLAEAECIAPELAAGQWPPDAASDVYALGCCLYQALTARLPFADGDLESKLIRHAGEEPTPIERLQPTVPPALAAIVVRMMAKLPHERFASASEAAEALLPFAGPIEDVVQQATSPTAAAFEDWLRSPAAPTAVVKPTPVVNTTSSDHTTATATPTALATESSPQAFPTAMVQTEVAVVDDSLSPTARARRGRGLRGTVLAAAAIVLAVGAIAGFTLFFQPPNTPPLETVSNPTPSEHAAHPTIDPAPPPVTETSPPESITGLSGPVWASPTSGPPLDLRYLPAGGQLFIALRPAELAASAEGQRLLEAPTPLGETLEHDLAALAGAPLADIEQVTVALLDGGFEPPRAALKIRFTRPVRPEEHLRPFGEARSETHAANGATYYVVGERAFYFPSDEDDRLLVTLPNKQLDVESLFASRAAPHPLGREEEALLQTSDADRHATILLTPRFLFSGGLLTGAGAPAKKPLDHFLGDDVQGLLLSLHLDENLFTELRMIGRAPAAPRELAEEFQARVAALPTAAEQFVLSIEASPYSRQVLFRYPGMVRLLADYSRAGVDGRQVVLRSVLPSKAAHNLLLGGWLALLESPGAPGSSADSDEPTERPAGTIEEQLDQPISLSFPRNTLETALTLFGEEIGVEMRILGGDLQLEGITKNQSFGLDQRDRPAEEILRTILSTADPSGKLVYIVEPPQAGARAAIVITTRAAAAKRGDRLPAALREDPP